MNDTSITSSDVDTPTSDHVTPPSSERASAPLGPVANTTEPESARIRWKVGLSRLPTGRHVAPESSVSTVVPPSPTATALLGELNDAAWIFCVDAVTDNHVAPPSMVRSTACVPFASRHTSAEAQRMLRSPAVPGAPLGVQVRPPSVVPRTNPPLPTA